MLFSFFFLSVPRQNSVWKSLSLSFFILLEIEKKYIIFFGRIYFSFFLLFCVLVVLRCYKNQENYYPPTHNYSSLFYYYYFRFYYSLVFFLLFCALLPPFCCLPKKNKARLEFCFLQIFSPSEQRTLLQSTNHAPVFQIFFKQRSELRVAFRNQKKMPQPRAHAERLRYSLNLPLKRPFFENGFFINNILKSERLFSRLYTCISIPTWHKGHSICGIWMSPAKKE